MNDTSEEKEKGPWKALQSLVSVKVKNSVTRFGEISPLWQYFQSLWAIFWMVYLVFGKLLYLLWHFYATGQIGIAVNGQRLNNKKPSGHTGLERRQRPSHTLPALAAAAVSQELVPMTWQENVYLFIVLVTPNVGGRQHIWSWSSLVERGETLYRPKW